MELSDARVSDELHLEWKHNLFDDIGKKINNLVWNLVLPSGNHNVDYLDRTQPHHV